MSNELEIKKKFDTIKGSVEKFKGEIQRALPKTIGIERFCRVAYTCFSQNPALLECTPTSIIRSLLLSAQCGIVPDGTLGKGYLIPYNIKNQMECTFQIGYPGLCDLARNSGQVLDIYANVVFEHDECNYTEGIDRNIIHKPVPPDKRGSDYVGVYAVAIFKNGYKKVEWMWKSEVDSIRKKAIGKMRNQAGSRWYVPEGENPCQCYEYLQMVKKTAIRRIAKTLPLQSEIARVLNIEDMQESDEQVVIDMNENGEVTADSSAPGKSKYENLENCRKEINPELKKLVGDNAMSIKDIQNLFIDFDGDQAKIIAALAEKGIK